MNKLNDGLAKILKNGVIIHVSSVEEAKIAEKAGARAVMVVEIIPRNIREQTAVARMANVSLIKEIKDSISIPVMAKCRIGHFVEARILEKLAVDFIDESEVLTPANHSKYIVKNTFKVPFVCGARNLGEALRRIYEGATMIRTKDEAGTGDISHAVKNYTAIKKEILNLKKWVDLDEYYLTEFCKKESVPVTLLQETLALERLPVVTFAGEGIATPADAALMMNLGVDGIFVGNGIFDLSEPNKMAHAICLATIYYNDYSKLIQACELLDIPMKKLARR